MNGRDENRMPELILERRVNRDAELSCSDIMKILRKRAAKSAAKRTEFEAQWDDIVR